MQGLNPIMSSASVEWPTPQDLFDRLNEKYRFTLDPCATPENAKCERFFTESDDGLKQSWRGERVFCNPPYGRGHTKRWVQKCAEEAKDPNTLIVLLIPARTDTAVFHDHLYQKDNVEIEFIRGRLKYGGGENNAPFPSMLVIFNGGK